MVHFQFFISSSPPHRPNSKLHTLMHNLQILTLPNLLLIEHKLTSITVAIIIATINASPILYSTTQFHLPSSGQSNLPMLPINQPPITTQTSPLFNPLNVNIRHLIIQTFELLTETKWITSILGVKVYEKCLFGPFRLVFRISSFHVKDAYSVYIRDRYSFSISFS